METECREIERMSEVFDELYIVSALGTLWDAL